MEFEHEKGEHLSPHEKLEKCFSEMTLGNEGNPSMRSSKLKDGTVVSMRKSRDPLDNPLISEYEIQVTRPISSECRPDQFIRFIIREDGTLKSITRPITVLVIGSKRIPVIHKRHDEESFAQKDSAASVFAAEFLTDWFCKVIKREKYFPPKISIPIE